MHPRSPKGPAAIARALRRGQRGQVFVLAALLLAVLGGMAAMAIDLGSFSANRRDLQNAADAIALAAAQELPNAGAAQTAANDWAVKNGIDPASMTVTVIPQNLPNQPNPKVHVELERDHEFTFARLVGIESKLVGAAATAIKTSPGGSGGLMPWSVKQADKDAATPGDSIVLKYDSRNVQNGNFGPLALDGTGANIYRDTIRYGSETLYCAASATSCAYPSQSDTEPGNMTGPTRVATGYRINNTDPACDSWSEVVVVSGGQHWLKPQCNPFTTGGNPGSLRVIIIPVIQNLCNGRCQVTINEFALFYLEGYGDDGCTGNSCEIRGRFINSNTNYGAYVGTFDPDTFAHFVRLVE